jgi:cell division protein FtsL
MKHNSAHKQALPKVQRPVPAQLVLASTLITALLVSFPLFLVWKQVSFSTCMRSQQKLLDSTAVIKSDIVRLRLKVEHLSAPERVERIARETRGLEYPASNRITIVRMEPQKNSSTYKSIADSRYIKALKRSMGGRG